MSNTPSQILTQSISNKKALGNAAFVPFITAGFPQINDTKDILFALEAGGADAIELGIPFSDPLADGGTIQRASHIALTNGMTTAKCLEIVKEAREAGLQVPLVLMGYYNPIAAFGEERFVQEAFRAGVNGFIVVDLPLEEAVSFKNLCDIQGMALIPLVAPTTTDLRLRSIVSVASGYIYCVSVTGITGQRSSLPTDLSDFIARIRRASGDIPLAVGFGISNRDHVKSVGEIADAVVVGSAIINCVEKAFHSSVNITEAVQRFVCELTEN